MKHHLVEFTVCLLFLVLLAVALPPLLVCEGVLTLYARLRGGEGR